MYRTKNHSKYSLKAHLVFTTKYRKRLFKNELLVLKLRTKFFEISNNANFGIELIETDKGHIHILVDYEPNISIVQIVRKLKQETTHYMWDIFQEELSKTYWKKTHVFWSKGYFVCSIGEGASYKTIQEYIKNQG